MCVCIVGVRQCESGGGYVDVRVSLCLCGASAFNLKFSQSAGSSSASGEAEAMRSLKDSSINEAGGGIAEEKG